MRTYSLALLLLLPACLPSKWETVPCSTDSECTAYASDLRCDLTLHECISPMDAGNPSLDGQVDITSDTSTPQCQTSATCIATAPICSPAGKCAACTASSQCAALADPAHAACSAAGACVQCTDNSTCGGATPLCDSTTNKCVACLTSATCPAATPICAAGTCTACSTSTQCAALADPARTVCSPTGTCVGCLTSATCPAAAPLCAPSGTCTACAASSQCAALADPARAVCSAAGACVQCMDNSTCAAGASVCDTTTNTCVGCTASATCTTATPICTPAKTCAACTAATQCAAKSATTPACSTSGTCVQCIDNTTCSGATPVCDTTTNKCVGCTASATCSGATPICSAAQVCTTCTAATQCAAKNAALPACSAAGACVQCTDNTTCSGATPVCDTTSNKCVGCTASATCAGATPICSTAEVCTACTAASQCAAKSAAQPVCSAAGACVQCTDNTTCSGTTPVCNATTNTCRACTADSECSGIGPGVCMTQQDGHCASDAETIVVTTGGTLPTAVPVGKRLLVVRGTVSGTIAWTLANPQMSIVGQNSGTLTGTGSTATLHVSGGDLYIRALTISGGSPGIWADTGDILRLDHVTVSNNIAGGILLDGAGFDIKNTTVNANGANTGAVPFGGIGLQNTPTLGTVPKSIVLTSITSNQLLGVTCGTGAAFSPTPTSVLASTNLGGDIGTSCGFTSCTPASTTCGAQP